MVDVGTPDSSAEVLGAKLSSMGAMDAMAFSVAGRGKG